MRMLFLCAALCAPLSALTACGPKTDMAVETTESALAESATPESAMVETGALPSAEVAPPAIPPCSTGATLTVTGACTDADPALFIKIDADRELMADACVWRSAEVQMSASEAIVFRTQDCSAAGWETPRFGFSALGAGGRLVTGVSADALDRTILEVLTTGPGQSAEQVALSTLVLAPEVERDRCTTRPLTGNWLAGETFQLTPDDAFQLELDEASQGEVYSACGPYGIADVAQMWEARDGKALFHNLGQDESNWDPVSFTFYRLAESGVWAKAG